MQFNIQYEKFKINSRINEINSSSRISVLPWDSTFDDAVDGDLEEGTVHSYKGSCNNTSSIVNNTSWDFLRTSRVFSEHLHRNWNR